MEIKGILVTILAPMSDHIANGGEKILGNASSIKQRPDGRVYISGQKQRHALFSAIDRLNLTDSGRGNTYVSNGDGVHTSIERNIRADLGGFMDTNEGVFTYRRTAPLTATPAVAMNPSEIGRDLLIRLVQNPNALSKEAKKGAEAKSKDQALATREYSQEDLMLMSFFVDIGAVGLEKQFEYDPKNGMHVNTHYKRHISEEERRRRIRLAVEASASLTDYANQARNAVSGEPQRVLLVLDTKLSRKASRYFRAGEAEQANILKELDKRGAKCFLGDDTSGEGMSVMDAYDAAYKFFDENTLFDPTGDAATITSEQFEKEG